MKLPGLKQAIDEEVQTALNEEWRGYKPNMPVQVVGVKNGRICSRICVPSSAFFTKI